MSIAKMIGPQDKLIETPELDRMDVLSDILASLRLTGGVVIDAETRGEWCLESQFTSEDCAPFLTAAGGKLVAYHYVRSGSLFAEVDGMHPIEAHAGDIILLPRNDKHLLYSSPGLDPVSSRELVDTSCDGPARIRIDGEGDPTSMFCGFLGASAGQHPLLDSLPPLLKLEGGYGARSEWLQSALRLLNEGNESPDVVARMAELFLAESIRSYMEGLPEIDSGWLAGLRDPAVSKALAVIHSRYAEDLDVETIAREAGVSRTVLGERFAAILGESPMRYAARWRMRVAANMLREGKDNSANIGYAVGFNSEAAFNRAFKREYGEPPATWRRRIETEDSLEQLVDTGSVAEQRFFCTASDGARLAYALSGDGYPLVKAPNWMTHLEHDWDSPIYGHWLAECARGHRFLRADMRGFGLSDWSPQHLSFDAMVADLATVIDAAGIEKCDLMGISHGSAIAVAYAAEHPDRVRRLVLLNSAPCGWAVRADPEEIAWRKSLMELNRQEYARRRTALGEMFVTLYFPSAGPELIEWHNKHLDLLSPPENIEAMLELAAFIDVREALARVKCKTLVCHARQDGNAPVALGRQVAGSIPGARYVELESANHVLLGNEPAWPQFVSEFRRFLNM